MHVLLTFEQHVYTFAERGRIKFRARLLRWAASCYVQSHRFAATARQLELTRENP